MTRLLNRRWLALGTMFAFVVGAGTVEVPLRRASAEDPVIVDSSAFCVVGSGSQVTQEWRVKIRSVSENGGPTVISPLAFEHRTPPGDWLKDTGRWAFRWDLTAAQWGQLQAGDFTFASQVMELQGTFEDLQYVDYSRISPYLSPRWVSPDGSCTVYSYPYAQTTNPSQPSVAVFGDSLVGQLNDAVYNQTYLQGWVQGTLLQHPNSRRSEIEGQAGRRWSPDPAVAGQQQANTHLRDEIRGLRGATTHVIALGVNDASWIVQGTVAERAGRTTYVLGQINDVINENLLAGQCTVLVTPADLLRPEGDIWGWDQASEDIGDHLRTRVDLDDTGLLRLVDWAELSEFHHEWNTEPPDEVWFAPDFIHLSQAGAERYTYELSQVPLSC